MDIDFITDITDQFTISFGDNPQGVEGNRALLNRFEITFLTKTRRYLLGGQKVIVDNYGGDAIKFVNRPQVLNDPQGIAAALSVTIDQTVTSLKSDEPPGVPNTERINDAQLIDLNIGDDGFINAQIQVIPIETEQYGDLVFNLPITRRG